MNFAKIISLLNIGMMCFLCCSKNSQQTLSKDVMDKLIEEEKKKENKAKYDSASTITIITDSSEVVTISKEIDKKIVHAKDAKQKLPEESVVAGLVNKYKTGDKTVVPQLISILKGTNTDQRIELYQNLRPMYNDDSSEFTISETELVNCILNNISHESDEDDVIQLAGIMQLNGYERIFEKILLKGTSKNQDRLIYWLSRSGKNTRVLSYLEKLIIIDRVNLVEHSDVVWGLESFAEKGTDSIRQKAYEICLEIYKKNMIDKSKYLEMKHSMSSTNPAENVVTILMNYGDDRSIPIALDLLKIEIEQGGALSALLRLDSKKYYPLMVQYLKDENTFYNGLYAAKEYYKLTKDDTVVKEILSQFEKRTDHSSPYIGMIVDDLIEIGAKKSLDTIDEIIHDSTLVDGIKKAVRIANCTAEDVANDLFRLGVVDKKIKKSVVDMVKKKNSKNQMSDLIDVSGIYYSFDSEADEIPVPYDSLIKSLLANSNGKFTDAKVWMDADIDEESESVTYTITLISNNKAYIAKPEDNGDWFNVETVLSLLNTALADANMKERYVFIDTGDQTVQVMFGPEKSVKEFIALYNL